MKIHISVATAVAMTGALFSSWVSAQVPSSLSEQDRAEIQALMGSYSRALGGCNAEAFAGLFVNDTGYFASGFRGQIYGHDDLVALVESERHCIAPPAEGAGGRSAGDAGPEVDIALTASGVRGVADLGTAEYQDEYVKTAAGWRFASRTVLLAAEKDLGLDAAEMLAIRELAGSELGDLYAADQNGVPRLRSSGVAIGVADGTVTGRAYLPEGGYNEDVYEKLGPGEWRIVSRHFVPAEP